MLLKEMYVDKLQSIVKADWDVIRKVKPLVTDWWLDDAHKMPKSCCGLLFVDAQVFATNGHWCIASRVKDKLEEGRVLFYNYITDDVVEENPFLELPQPITIADLRALYYQWRTINVKVRIEDLYKVVDSIVGIKEKRATLFSAVVDKKNSRLNVEMTHRKGKAAEDYVEVYQNKFTNNTLVDGARFDINLNYLHKMIEIVEPHYHVIEFCFDNDGSPIHIKAKNNHQDKPPFKIAVAQASVNLKEA